MTVLDLNKQEFYQICPSQERKYTELRAFAVYDEFLMILLDNRYFELFELSTGTLASGPHPIFESKAPDYLNIQDHRAVKDLSRLETIIPTDLEKLYAAELASNPRPILYFDHSRILVVYYQV